MRLHLERCPSCRVPKLGGVHLEPGETKNGRGCQFPLILRVRWRVPDLIPHDLRRSSVRNLERAGVPRTTAMALVGHETESTYRRYAIQDETKLKEGAVKLSDFYTKPDRRAEAERKVIPIAR